VSSIWTSIEQKEVTTYCELWKTIEQEWFTREAGYTMVFPMAMELWYIIVCSLTRNVTILVQFRRVNCIEWLYNKIIISWYLFSLVSLYHWRPYNFMGVFCSISNYLLSTSFATKRHGDVFKIEPQTRHWPQSGERTECEWSKPNYMLTALDVKNWVNRAPSSRY
jgi:hypothetical protein